MKILFTSAIIEQNFEERKEEYLKSLTFLKENGLVDSIQIIETVLESDSFFEQLGYKIFYSKTHKPNLKNKGVKEILALKSYLQNAELSDNEMLIKITGRYKFLDTFFLKTVNNDKFDFYYLPVKNQVFFGCIAMRKKYFVELINSIDLNVMEKYMINIESKTYEYLQQKSFKKFEFDKINFYSNINNQKVVIW